MFLFRNSILIFLTCACFLSLSQPINNHIGDVTMPSATASSFGRFSDVPVSHYTGVPRINIPIYTIMEGPLTVPIALSYHAGGVRVAEIASSAGTGWTMQTGGNVSRTVQGIPDESINGYLNKGGSISLSSGCVQVTGTSTPIADMANAQLDGEPDIFTFSAGPYHGRFHFNSAAEVVLIPSQDIKITYELTTGYGAKRLKGFVITTPDGTEYHFGDILSNTDAIETSEINDVSNSTVATNWYIKRVNTYDDAYHIDYNYRAENYRHFVRSFGGTFTKGSYLTNQTDIVGYHIDQISTGSGTVTIDFIEGAIRSDLDNISGTHQARQLDRIEVSTGSYCKKFLLYHDYWEDNSSLQSGSTEDYRLKLDSIQEKSCNNTLEIPSHAFLYHEGSGSNYFPTRLSAATDHWGYYNGASGNPTSGWNIPYTKLEYSIGSTPVVAVNGDSDRETHEDSMKVGTLRSRRYPTGGSHTFAYEANDYWDTQGLQVLSDNILSPALDISGCTSSIFTESSTFTYQSSVDYIFKWITENSSLGSGQICCESSPYAIIGLYNASGSTLLQSTSTGVSCPGLSEKQDYLTNLFSYSFQNNVTYTLKISVFKCSSTFDLHEEEIVSQNVNRKVGGLRIDSLISYDRVSHEHDVIITYEYTAGIPGQSSGVLYNEPIYGFVFNGPSSTCSTNPPTQNSIVTHFWLDQSVVPLFGFEGHHLGYSQVKEYYNGSGYKQYIYYTETPSASTGYPMPPPSPRVEAGHIQVEACHSEGTEDGIKKVTRTKKSESYVPSAGTYVKTQWLTDGSSNTIAPWIDYTIESKPFRLSTMIEERDGVATTTNFEYSSSDYLMPSAIWMTNSDNRVHRQEFKYTPDFSGTAYTNLESDNVLALVEELQKVNGVLVDGNRRHFGLFNGVAYPSLIERYEASWNASGTKYVEGTTGWVEQGTYTAYTNGNPITYQDLNWDHTIDLTWTASGKLAKWKYFNFERQFQYFAGTDLLKKIIEIDQTSTSFTYDALLRQKTITDDCRNIVSTLNYHYHINGSNQNYVESSTVYDDFGETLGSQTIINWDFYDGLGRDLGVMQRQQHPNGSDHIMSSIHYDTVGRVTQVFEPRGISNAVNIYPGPQGDSTVYGYQDNPLGRLSSIAPPKWYVTLYDYNSNGSGEVLNHKAGASYAVDLLYKTIVTDPNGNHTEVFTDKRGRRVLQRRSDDNFNNDNNTFTLYDDKDRKSQMLPHGTNLTSGNLIFEYLYHGDDQLKERKVPGKGIEKFVYNDRDLLAYRQDANMLAENRWYATQYDTYGRSISEGFSTTPVSLLHNNFTQAGIDNKLLDYTYGTQSYDKDKLTFTDAAMLTNGEHIRSYYTYDICGRLTKETRNTPAQYKIDTSRVVEYAYDDLDQIIMEEIRVPSGPTNKTRVVNTYHYDHNGRAKKDLIQVDQQNQKTIADYTYTVKEQIDQLKLGGNLQSVDYEYKPNRLLYRINQIGILGSDVFALELNYDEQPSHQRKNGDIAYSFWANKSSSYNRYQFHYDHLDRLTSADYLDVSSRNFAVSMDYDARSNISSLERHGYTNAGGTSQGDIDDLTYTYGSGNRIQSISDATSQPWGYDANAGNYDYDDNGNMIRDPGKECDLYYNHLNLLDSIAMDDGQVIRFSCDAMGLLHQKSIENAEEASLDRIYLGQVELLNGHVDVIHHSQGYINVLYAVPDELVLIGTEPQTTHTYEALKITSSRTNTTGKSITYTAGQIELLKSFDAQPGSALTLSIQDFTPTELEYVFTIRDHLGNHRVFFSDENGNGSIAASEIISEHDYYPFGLEFGGPNGLNDAYRYRYNDKERLELTGYYNYGARCMDASIGRFGGVDPLASDMPSWSPYSAMFNNPIRFVDPTGMSPETIYEDAETGQQVEVNDGIDKTIVVNSTDFQKAKFFANELNQGEEFSLPDMDIVNAYTDFYNEHNRYEGLSFSNAMDYLFNKPQIEGVPIGGAGSLEVIGGGAKTAVKPIARQVPRFLVKMQKHHIIPKAVFKRNNAALAPFMKLNSGLNLKKLPTPFHGNHPQYNTFVGNQIQNLINSGNLNAGSLRGLQKTLNAQINQAYDSGMKLNDYFRQLNKL